MNDLRLSKLLSLVLRHEPQHLGLALDAAGWTSVEGLLAACRDRGIPLTLDRLQQIVAASDKQRFAFDASRTHIRASQGHSVQVELGYQPQSPPSTLYHGTVAEFVPGIRAHGLRKQERHHVHLSADEATALKVGARRGDCVLLQVAAAAMSDAGHQFFRSANGVWLVDHVPVDYIVFPPGPVVKD